MYFIGKISSTVENKIAMLRTAKMLKTLAGRPITKETMLDCIQKCNDEVHLKFAKGMKEVRPYTSKIPPQGDLTYAGVRVVCEDTRLSLRHSGLVYLGIDTKMADIPTIDPQQLEDMLDISAAAFDLENLQVGGETSKLRWAIMGSPGFQRTRVLMAQLCG